VELTFITGTRNKPLLYLKARRQEAGVASCWANIAVVGALVMNRAAVLEAQNGHSVQPLRLDFHSFSFALVLSP
jgi:hypothetical protein